MEVQMIDWRGVEMVQESRREALLAEARLARAVSLRPRAGWFARFVGLTILLLGMLAWLVY
jgi:hypothetical protein